MIDHMTPDDIHRRLALLVQDLLGLEFPPSPDARFVVDLGCDSLDMADLWMEAEVEFGIDITVDEGEKLTSVREAASFISARLV